MANGVPNATLHPQTLNNAKLRQHSLAYHFYPSRPATATLNKHRDARIPEFLLITKCLNKFLLTYKRTPERPYSFSSTTSARSNEDSQQQPHPAQDRSKTRNNNNNNEAGIETAGGNFLHNNKQTAD